MIDSIKSIADLKEKIQKLSERVLKLNKIIHNAKEEREHIKYMLAHLPLEEDNTIWSAMEKNHYSDSYQVRKKRNISASIPLHHLSTRRAYIRVLKNEKGVPISSKEIFDKVKDLGIKVEPATHNANLSRFTASNATPISRAETGYYRYNTLR